MPTTETLVHMLKGWAEERPNSHAIHSKKDGAWESYTWAEYWTAVQETAKGLAALGHEPDECVALVGNNRNEWVICEFAIMANRGAPAPIYTTNTVEQVAYIVDHCRAKLAICDNQEQLDKYLEGIEQGLINGIEKIIVFDDIGGDHDLIMHFDELRALGREQDDSVFEERLNAMESDETALLIYTSGTTGVPKAVMLSNSNLTAMANMLHERVEPVLERDVWRMVSYLPLCHVAEQLMTTFIPLRVGGEVYFCPDLKQIKEYLVEVHPTVFMGVPRVWEKFQAVMEARFAEATGVKAKLLDWARKTELAEYKKDMAAGRESMSLSRTLARKVVLTKITGALGFDQLLGGFTGAAPISASTLEFFASIGIPVFEAYGMSETSGVSTAQELTKVKLGTVGKALPGVTIKIAEDGEVLLKGPNMTKGYLHMPEKTAELLDDEGWLHTGDLGSLDSDGYLTITGRKKDILITAGGKNIAPAEMEAYMKSIPGIGQAVVVGDRQPYLSALVTLDAEALPELAEAVGISNGSYEAVATNPKVHEYLEPLIESECNAKVARYQTVKKFKIMPVDFTVDTGELTPTMKLKRNVISEKYADDIAALYN